MSDTRPIGIGPYLVACAAMLFLAACVVAGAVVYALPKLGTVKPSPTPTANLAALVPDAAARGQLSAFFGDFAALMGSESKPLKTTGEFREAYGIALTLLQSTKRLPEGLGAFDEAASNQLAASIGLSDAPLDGQPPVRANLATALRAIAEGVR
jgi:hypothetical protein